ncbi:MAG: indole-3-glycerol phosphate synthase [SAR86 cluster bacterium SAR86A]|uniref:Indole-3-glycerol phosphate synthase n=1 Tax=SAR86 cluster bacterium SAR86A TaxID=1123866 RepID=J4KRL2_9GAMM|nr:MAG: indole-3-glycerol phosphate synthase [SAR86 cluster bacterium SAR86A]
MMNILDEIVAKTKSKLEEKKQGLSLEELSSKIDFENLKETNFKKSLQNKAEAIIAEIKKASPSAGIISDDFDPVLKSKEYESFGASALSILTEEDYFLGNIQYLMDVKAITSLPILRKDFIVDEYQIYESKLIGADCILLIASILNDEELKNFSEIAERLKLDYIIEVHDEEELQRVQHFSNAIIGVNNRNLKTFDVDINNSVALKKIFEGENIFIAESGIKSKKDIEYLQQHNINVFLIGESLMKGDFFET